MAISSLPEVPPGPQPEQMPEGLLRAFLISSLCVGFVLSYLTLRSSWHGWPLVGTICIGMYGVSTVAAQFESLFFLSNKLPRGMIRAIFLQGAITTALFAPLAVLLLGKWRAVSWAPAFPAPARISVPSAAWRLALLVVAFVFLYMFFGYYVAWQSPAVRQYYGGLEYSSFYASLKANWISHRWIYPLQVFRALLYIGSLYPITRMLRVARWEMAVALALFLSVWTTVLLLPNSMMPPSVARSHFRETLGFSLVFRCSCWLLLEPSPARRWCECIRECGTVCEVLMQNFFQLGVRDAELLAPNRSHASDGRVIERVAKGVSANHSSRARNDETLLADTGNRPRRSRSHLIAMEAGNL